MATTTTQPVAIKAAASANPLVRWHLFSLDAPTVASLWTFFIARANGVHLPAITVAAMFCAVWTLYAADRLLDARAISPPYPGPAGITAAHSTAALEARHLFHHRHRERFLAAIVLAVACMAFVIPHLNATAIRLFAAEGLLLAAWFTTLHATPFARHLPKELALGAFFSAAVCIPTAARLNVSPLHLVPAEVLFAAVCSLNCLFIYRWESSLSTEAAHPSTRFAARYTSPAALAIVVVCAACTAVAHTSAALVPPACALASAALLLLDRMRARLDRNTLRAAADLALLTPLLLLPFTR